MKKCPHCQEDTFGAGQLFALDYFSADHCRNCKQLVRNDGLRQILALPAILGGFAVGMLLSSVVPDVLKPLPYLLIFVLTLLPMILLPKPVKLEQDPVRPPFSPDLENDKIITVSGWNEVELREIIVGFVAENFSGWPLGRYELHKESENRFRLNFPEDIHPSLFASLVNYVQCPIEFEITNRKIIVTGRTTLNGAFDGIPKELLGQKAVLYVPENNEDCDVVCLQSESGLNFANSLCEDHWRPVDDARLPPGLKR